MGIFNNKSCLLLGEMDKKVNDFYVSIPIENSNNTDMEKLDDLIKEAVCILHKEIDRTVEVRKGIKREVTFDIEYINEHYNGVFLAILIFKKIDLCKHKIADENNEIKTYR